MRRPKNNLIVLILFSLAVFGLLFFRFYLKMYPLLDLMKFLESREYYWVIPTTVLIVVGFGLLHLNMKRKIARERVEIFNATIRTIQDILHNSASSMQLLILDMKEDGVSEEIITGAEKNFDDLKKAIQTLSAIDPENIEVKELKRNMSILKMDE